MSIKYFCDICNGEIPKGQYYSFEITRQELGNEPSYEGHIVLAKSHVCKGCYAKAVQAWGLTIEARQNES